MKKSSLFNFLGAGLVLMTTALVSCNGGDTNATTDSDSTITDASVMSSGDTSSSSMTRAMATISGTVPDTTVNGTAEFTTASNGKVKMMLSLTIPAKANKSVAVHIHETPDCGDMGKMTGGHWNPTTMNHGKWGSSSYHAGDIGNVSLDASGKATMELESDLWSIGGDSTKNILNRAIIVHAGEDDYKSQPSGNSGNRIGCGVIK